MAVLTNLFFASPVAALTSGRIDSNHKYAWSENVGWINFGCSTCNVRISDADLTGFAWSQNYGWINLSPSRSGVKNNGEGDLSGNAWGENLGWISFDNVFINRSGRFVGRADNPVTGVINFDCDRCAVLTDWRPRSVRPIIDRPTIIERIPEIINRIPQIFRPPQPPRAPIEEKKPDEVPLVFRGKWELIHPAPIRRFVLAPLPSEIRRLAEKFPQLDRTLGSVGINRIADITRLRASSLRLPGLTERVVLPEFGLDDRIDPPRGVPIARLTPQMREQLPSEVVFAKTGGGLIDFGINLSINEEGEVEQSISTVLGTSIQLITKPVRPVRGIKGYITFKSDRVSQDGIEQQKGSLETDPSDHRNLSDRRSGVLLNSSLLASSLFSAPGLARAHQEPIEIENVFVLKEFDYTDPDGDSIYTAEIQAPLVKGEYEIITVFDYTDAALRPQDDSSLPERAHKKEIRMIMLIDPEGYIYEQVGKKQTRIPDAVVSIYRLNRDTGQSELWPAGEYLQKNPQITDVSGTYSFLTPEGYYYIKVEAPGYLTYTTKPFQVEEGRGVHINIGLTPQNWWLAFFDWRTIVLILVIGLLLYNFYRDRLRERLNRVKSYVSKK